MHGNGPIESVLANYRESGIDWDIHCFSFPFGLPIAKNNGQALEGKLAELLELNAITNMDDHDRGVSFQPQFKWKPARRRDIKDCSLVTKIDT